MIAALASNVPVIAKIERLSALKDIDAIAAASDGLMVARGDLGVEVRVEKVPAYQRKIIAAAAANGKPVIIATQMLESMIENPLASLAEVADVANGVLESADCLMLSAETASGKYPVQTLRKMIAVIDAVEHWTLTHRNTFTTPQRQACKEQITDWETHTAIAAAACRSCRQPQRQSHRLPYAVRLDRRINCSLATENSRHRHQPTPRSHPPPQPYLGVCMASKTHSFTKRTCCCKNYPRP